MTWEQIRIKDNKASRSPTFLKLCHYYCQSNNTYRAMDIQGIAITRGPHITLKNKTENKCIVASFAI